MIKIKSGQILSRLLTIACLLGLSIPSVYAEQVSPPKNFIVIFADDFGYGDLGCYRELFQGGDDRSLAHKFTPNLDRLGQQGVRFMQAYSASWCAPARQNLLSGRWCNRADTVQRPWVGKQLRDAGYSTCFIGKSHGNNSTAKVLNMDPTTAEFNDGFFFPGGARGFYLRAGEKFPRRIDFKADPFVAKGGEYITDVFTDFGVDFIRRSAASEKPFFLYIAHTAPHSPLDGKLEDLQLMFPGEFDDLNEADWREFLNATDQFGIHSKPAKKLRGLDKPIDGWTLKESASYQQMRKLGLKKYRQYNFAALVYRMDLGIGRLMQALEASGKAEDTMVIFTSDNGSTLGSNYPLTGHKSSHFEGGVRVPMIVWSKALADASAQGRIVEELTPTTAITPTLVAIAEQTDQPKLAFDGINLWPYLAEDRAVPDDQIYYYASDTSQLFKALGMNSHREPEMGMLKKMVDDTGDNIFGQAGKLDRIFNAVYIKGKEKLVYWSTLDGSARGAVYKQLPTGARSFENPVLPFKEQTVVAGEFPQSDAGRQLLKEFVEYTAAPGPGELMHAAVFHSDGNHDNVKRAREYVQDLP